MQPLHKVTLATFPAFSIATYTCEDKLCLPRNAGKSTTIPPPAHTISDPELKESEIQVWTEFHHLDEPEEQP